MRTCAKIAFEECKVANGVTYCYCKSELCNNPDRKLSDPGSNLVSSRDQLIIEHASSSSHQGDDEDYDEYEGSGDYNYYPYSPEDDTENDDMYDPDDADRTEPPPFIVDETDLYRKNTPPPSVRPPVGGNDFGFSEDNRPPTNYYDQNSPPPRQHSAATSSRPDSRFHTSFTTAIALIASTLVILIQRHL